VRCPYGRRTGGVPERKETGHPSVGDGGAVVIPSETNDRNDLVEYGLLIATIAIIVLVATLNFGAMISPWFEALANRIVTIT